MEDNSQERTPDIFHDFFETLEEFLETYEVNDPAVPQHQLCAALASRSPVSPKAPEGQDSILDQHLEELQIPGPPDSQPQLGPQKPTQNQARALDPLLHAPPICVSLTPQGPAEDKFSAGDQLLEELMETTSWEQNTSCSAPSNSTAASHMMPHTDMQKTFSGDQTLREGSTETSGSQQTPRQINTPLSGAPGINGTQMSFTGDQTLHRIQRPFSSGRFVSGTQMPIGGAQSPWGTMTSYSGDQAQCGSQMSPTAHQNENASQISFSVDKFIQKDSSMEDKSQKRTTNIFHKNHAEFLQTCEAVDPAGPDPELCGPLTPQGPASTQEALDGQDILDQLLKELQIPRPVTLHAQGSPNEPCQNQANTLDTVPEGPQFSESLTPQGQGSPQLPTEDKDSALNQLLEELMNTPSWEQNMSCSAQSNPTAAAHMTPDTDVLKTFTGDQTLQEGQPKTPGSEQSPCGYHVPYTGTQIINGIQLPFIGAQMLLANHIPFSGHQTPSGTQRSLTGQQTVFGTPMSMSMNQSCSRNQVPFTSAQILLMNQVSFSGVHPINGNQMLHSGVQMIPVTGIPTVTFISDQTLTGSQHVTQSGTQRLYGIQMVPQGSPLPQSGFLYASAPLVQGPSLKSQKPKKRQRRKYHINADGLKPYACTFQGCGKQYAKPYQLRIHERVHTGDKPYICDVKGCPWKFARSDELSRHKKTHTGERPYRCPQCPMDFARADHLKQHARVHR